MSDQTIKAVPNDTFSFITRIGQIKTKEDKKLSEFLYDVLGGISTEGMNFKEMSERFKILDALETANGDIDIYLTPAQWKEVSKAYSKIRFVKIDKAIVAIGQKLEEIAGA
jgi:hypothetical protein